MVLAPFIHIAAPTAASSKAAVTRNGQGTGSGTKYLCSVLVAVAIAQVLLNLLISYYPERVARTGATRHRAACIILSGHHLIKEGDIHSHRHTRKYQGEYNIAAPLRHQTISLSSSTGGVSNV